MPIVTVKFFRKEGDNNVQLVLKTVGSIRMREQVDVVLPDLTSKEEFQDEELVGLLMRRLQISSCETYPVVSYGKVTVTRKPINYTLNITVTRFEDGRNPCVCFVIEGDNVDFQFHVPNTVESLITLNHTRSPKC